MIASCRVKIKSASWSKSTVWKRFRCSKFHPRTFLVSSPFMPWGHEHVIRQSRWRVKTRMMRRRKEGVWRGSCWWQCWCMFGSSRKIDGVENGILRKALFQKVFLLLPLYKWITKKNQKTTNYNYFSENYTYICTLAADRSAATSLWSNASTFLHFWPFEHNNIGKRAKKHTFPKSTFSPV